MNGLTDKSEGRPEAGLLVAGRDRVLGLSVSALLAGSIAVTLISGAPTSLPDAALASAVLLHAERAGALFLLSLGALALVRAAFAGQLPTEVSPQGVKLAERGIEGVQEGLGSLQRAFQEADAKLDAAEEAVRASEELVAVERARIDVLERRLGGRDEQ